MKRINNFLIDKVVEIEMWAKVPPLQGNEKLWSGIIKNNIPTKIDDKTGCLVYLYGVMNEIKNEIK